ncbi:MULTISPECIES: tellurite resistance TerB family protein [unclassified Roseofilum]|uniref:tellurite resistance TerB family protein n=1 Tax=unclassified Roseofilum TaxID=2620099 RepID=UPI000E913071|nr:MULTISPECIES: tellurite resistance TerB family protein [unclassified Roseofilum]HBR00049.1 Tellurite resistance protein TerB [Cyanobacteria bacterium UBA11691]MBP0007084.1 tellurite resistance TerB family protein [Roseofilum sp. Belize Diploria]MBP0015170.1 tellurite resistance TerB family protein [Roseofilum sp. SID3]MBP0022806.1 tellurite resistance TerB family protein [Roseofilum sp. SID2]MBP0031592.1 tellurite resistance TerB family protein [Roseofilum sp. Belize BBD 4]
MGLFDAFRKETVKSQLTLGPAEAFAAVMLLVVAADGYLADDEVRLLNTTLSRMRLFRSYSDDVMRRMFDSLCGTLRRDGGNVLFDAAIATLPHDLYDTTFAIATDLVLADGQVSDEEEDLLGSLCRALELPDTLVNQIIQVMMIKNKG